MNRSANRRRMHSPPLLIKDGLNPSRVRVPTECADMPAFEFVWQLKISQRYRHPDDTQAELYAAFARGEVRLGLWPHDQELSPTTHLSAGSDVWFYRMPAIEPEVPYQCEVIDEDENLLVIDKPPFLATMPRGKHITQTATVQLRRTTGNGDLSPAHRLDRLTSGVLVFTKKPDIRGAYQRLFAERKTEKIYEAIAAVQPEIVPGTVWRSRMEKTAGEVQGRIVPGEVNAITNVYSQTLCDAPRMSTLRKIHGDSLPQQALYVLRPETGRTHQLRLHMWAAGIAILGDPAYPIVKPENYEDFGTPMHLTARELRFDDPLTGKPRVFRSNRQW